MPVWCAQTWAQWRWHGRMIQDACAGAAAALSAQWTWALPQIPHRPAGWRHVTLHPPGQTKVGFAQQFCSASGAGPAPPFTKSLNGSGAAAEPWHRPQVCCDTAAECLGWCRFIHACGFLLFDAQVTFILILSESVAESACTRHRPSWLMTAGWTRVRRWTLNLSRQQQSSFFMNLQLETI